MARQSFFGELDLLTPGVRGDDANSILNLSTAYGKIGAVKHRHPYTSTAYSVGLVHSISPRSVHSPARGAAHQNRVSEYYDLAAVLVTRR